MLFALAIGKTLITDQQPFIEVSSTEGVYVRKANAIPLSDTQCWQTETPEEQLCSGNNRPTRIRFLPDEHPKIGLYPSGISQLEYALHPSPVTDPLFPGQDVLPNLNPEAKAIATEILQGVERQSEIIKIAKQQRLMLLHLSDDKMFEELGEEDTEEDIFNDEVYCSSCYTNFVLTIDKTDDSTPFEEGQYVEGGMFWRNGGLSDF